jgi:hypothetical protein
LEPSAVGVPGYPARSWNLLVGFVIESVFVGFRFCFSTGLGVVDASESEGTGAGEDHGLGSGVG